MTRATWTCAECGDTITAEPGTIGRCAYCHTWQDAPDPADFGRRGLDIDTSAARCGVCETNLVTIADRDMVCVECRRSVAAVGKIAPETRPSGAASLGSVLRSYARGIDGGAFDRDVTEPDARRALARYVRLAAEYADDLNIDYVPVTRAAAARARTPIVDALVRYTWREYAWREYAWREYDIDRTIAIIRNV